MGELIPPSRTLFILFSSQLLRKLNDVLFRINLPRLKAADLNLACVNQISPVSGFNVNFCLTFIHTIIDMLIYFYILLFVAKDGNKMDNIYYRF